MRAKTIFPLLIAAVLLVSACGKAAVSQNSADLSRPVQTAAAEENQHQGVIGSVTVSYDYQRMPTMASNQIAVWIEDSNGQVVRTLYVSGFTGSRRGYERRKESLNHWVAAANPAGMDDKTIDAVSSATPASGLQTVSWDLKNDSGQLVPPGIYTLKLEGTLYWGSNVLYTGTVDTKKGPAGDLNVQMQRSEADNEDNEMMISQVRMMAYS